MGILEGDIAIGQTLKQLKRECYGSFVLVKCNMARLLKGEFTNASTLWIMPRQESCENLMCNLILRDSSVDAVILQIGELQFGETIYYHHHFVKTRNLWVVRKHQTATGI